MTQTKKCQSGCDPRQLSYKKNVSLLMFSEKFYILNLIVVVDLMVLFIFRCMSVYYTHAVVKEDER